MKHLLGLIIIAVGLSACKKSNDWLSSPGMIEKGKLHDGIVGKRYVFTKGIDTKGVDLLKTKYPCMAGDTFDMEFNPYGRGPFYSVNIKQAGDMNCAPFSGDIKATWGLESVYTNDAEVSIWFPFPITTTRVDTNNTIIGYDYYSPVGFFKFADDRPHFRYDSFFNLEFIFYTDSTEEHYYLSSLHK